MSRSFCNIRVHHRLWRGRLAIKAVSCELRWSREVNFDEPQEYVLYRSVTTNRSNDGPEAAEAHSLQLAGTHMGAELEHRWQSCTQCSVQDCFGHRSMHPTGRSFEILRRFLR